MIIAIGDAEQCSARAHLSGAAGPSASDGRTGLGCANARGAAGFAPALPDTDEHGRPLWQKLMVFTSEASRHDGTPIHRALVRRLWESGSATGATVLRGIWGYHGDQEPHGDKLIQFGRHVPVMTVVVGSPASIACSFEVVDAVTGPLGLVTCEMVPALVSVGDGRRRQHRPGRLPLLSVAAVGQHGQQHHCVLNGAQAVPFGRDHQQIAGSTLPGVRGGAHLHPAPQHLQGRLTGTVVLWPVQSRRSWRSGSGAAGDRGRRARWAARPARGPRGLQLFLSEPRQRDRFKALLPSGQQQHAANQQCHDFGKFKPDISDMGM